MQTASPAAACQRSRHKGTACTRSTGPPCVPPRQPRPAVRCTSAPAPAPSTQPRSRTPTAHAPSPGGRSSCRAWAHGKRVGHLPRVRARLDHTHCASRPNCLPRGHRQRPSHVGLGPVVDAVRVVLAGQAQQLLHCSDRRQWDMQGGQLQAKVQPGLQVELTCQVGATP